MKAIVINQFGGPEQLHPEELPMPVARKGQVLVKIHASSVNPIDFKVRQGAMKFMTGKKFPKILGGDIAGVVQQDSGAFRTGDKVFGMLSSSGGAYAEYIAVNTEQLCLMPEGFSFEEAAAVPLAALTALQALQKSKRTLNGLQVLINGASGGVGHFAVQIAKALGATVTAVSSQANHDMLKSLGADAVIDYHTEKFYRSSARYDIVFDAAGAVSYFKSRKVMNPNGWYVTTLPNHGYIFYRLFNIFRNKKVSFIMTSPKGIDLKLIAQMMEKGQVKPVIDAVFPLDAVANAHVKAETNRTKGKIVLKVV